MSNVRLSLFKILRITNIKIAGLGPAEMIYVSHQPFGADKEWYWIPMTNEPKSTFVAQRFMICYTYIMNKILCFLMGHRLDIELIANILKNENHLAISCSRCSKTLLNRFSMDGSQSDDFDETEDGCLI